MQTETLEKLCDLIVDCPHFTPRWTDRGVIVTRNQNIRNGRLDLSSPSYTDEDTYKKRIRRATPSEGDLIFTREAPMGEICMIPKGLKCCLGQRQVLLRPNKDIDGRYLLYAMQSKYVLHQVFWSEGTGSTISNVRLPDLKALKIPRNQHSELAIAKTLGALDDKIENNRQMNETLEEMASAIFKSWFMDFDPVHAKAAGNAPTNMDAETAALFPSSFGDDGLPVGWEVRTVSDFAKIKGGKQLPKTRFVEKGECPVFGGAGEMGRTDQFNAEGFVITVGRVGAYCGQFFSHRGNAWVNNNASQIMPSNDVSGEWLITALRALDLEPIKKGAAQPFVSNSDIAALPIVYPSEQVLKVFAELICHFQLKIEANQTESATLSSLRDTLLPKLMSGEIRMKDAEREVEVAV